MRGVTHISAGVLASAALALTLPETGLLLVGSLLPDIDTPTSKISHCTSGIPGLFLGHRGVTHSLLFAAAAYFLLPYLAAGILTHIILDLLNASGVRLLWPLPIRVSFASIKTNGIVDYLTCALCIACTICLFARSL